MRSKLNLHIPGSRNRVGLYALVFASRISLITVGLLFVSFLIQPVHLAYANEAAAEAEAAELAAEPSLNDVAFEEVPDEVVEEASTAVEVTVEDSEEPSINSPDTETGGSTAVPEEASDPIGGDTTAEEISEDTARQPETNVSTEVASTTDQNDEPSQITATSTDIKNEVTGNISTSSPSIYENIATSTPDTVAASSTGATTTNQLTDTDTIDGTSNEGGSGEETVSDDNETDIVNTTEGVTDDTPEQPSSDNTNENTGSDEISEVPDTAVTAATTTTAGKDAALTETETSVVTKAENLVTDSNYYQFGKQACVSVGGGTYHCSIAEGKIVDSQAVVYSEIGPSGSPEIFIKTSKGAVEQITDNNFEDSSPHYDPVSQKIAWQRLIQGRYQIIIYDIPSAEEKQLTFSRTNNMEPSVSIAGVVWQAWDNNDWEVMYYDGTYTDQLTNNATQDVAPVLQEEYIIWTVIGGGEQFAQVYSLETKETVTISNHEGGSILNPRFVLVYDTQFDNGDVVTQRFDPVTGFAQPIAAKPAEAPMDIPQPDTTGEIKALIQTKSTSKQTSVVNGTTTDSGTGDIGSSATTTSGTLNLTPDLSAQVSDDVVSTSTDGLPVIESEDTVEEPFELTEYDLILPPTPTTTAPVQVSTSTEITF